MVAQNFIAIIGCKKLSVCLSVILPVPFHCFVILSLQPDTAVIVMNNPGAAGGEADVDKAVEVSVDDEEEEGELEVVQPTEEWQTLKPGGALSHVCWEGGTISNPNYVRVCV